MLEFRVHDREFILARSLLMTGTPSLNRHKTMNRKQQTAFTVRDALAGFRAVFALVGALVISCVGFARPPVPVVVAPYPVATPYPVVPMVFIPAEPSFHGAGPYHPAYYQTSAPVAFPAYYQAPVAAQVVGYPVVMPVQYLPPTHTPHYIYPNPNLAPRVAQARDARNSTSGTSDDLFETPPLLGPAPATTAPLQPGPNHPVPIDRSSAQPLPYRANRPATPAPMSPALMSPVPVSPNWQNNPGAQSAAAKVACNSHLILSEQFLNRWVARREVEPGEVRDFILGADVFGRRVAETQLAIDLKPSSETARMVFVLEGQINTATTGYTNMAAIQSVGRQEFVATKDVFFNGREFATRHAGIFIRAANQPTGARTAWSGTLFGPMAERIAIRAAERKGAEADAVARQRVAAQVFPEFDGEIDRRLSQVNDVIADRVRRALTSVNLLPSAEYAGSTETHLRYSVRMGSTSDPATISTPPSVSGSAQCVWQVHESSLNYLTNRLKLQGVRTSDRQLRALLPYIDRVVRSLGFAELIVPSNENAPSMMVETEIVLDNESPLQFRFKNQVIEMVMRASFRPGGQAVLPSMEVTIPYTAQLQGGRWMIAPGRTRVRSLERTDTSDEETMVERLVRQSIENDLPTFAVNRQVSFPVNGASASISLEKVESSSQGWLTIEAR